MMDKYLVVKPHNTHRIKKILCVSCTDKECLLSNASNVLVYSSQFQDLLCSLGSELDRILNFSLKWARQNKFFTYIQKMSVHTDCSNLPQHTRTDEQEQGGAAGMQSLQGRGRRQEPQERGRRAPARPRFCAAAALRSPPAAPSRERRSPGRRLRPAPRLPLHSWWKSCPLRHLARQPLLSPWLIWEGCPIHRTLSGRSWHRDLAVWQK